MPFNVWLIKEPWDFLNGDEIKIEFPKHHNQTISLDFTFNRYLLVPQGCKVIIGDYYCSGESLTSFFTLEGKKYQRLLIPVEPLTAGKSDSSLKILLSLGDEKYAFVLKATLHIETLSNLKSFVLWQIDNFQQLLDYEQDPCGSECDTKQGVRKTWETAQKIWLKDQNQESDAPISLIVRLARDNNLLTVLKAILINPNKVLKRERTLENIAAVSEVDANCLQWLIRQPGVSVQEKAGPQQKILAVTRQETYDILENRVTCWVVRRLLMLAGRFLNENSCYSESEKFQIVRKLSVILGPHLDASHLRDIFSCEHFLKPNFVLMHHHNYKIIWKYYLILRKAERLEDDCWRWQSNMWCESGRQLLGCIFIMLANNSKIFKELATSSTYIRKEPMNGLWIDTPVTPGPFNTSKDVVDYIDVSDGDSGNIRSWMNMLGAQQVLRQIRNDGTVRLLIIWFWNPVVKKDNFKKCLNDCHQALNQSLSQLDYKKFEVTGLIIASNVFDENVVTSRNVDKTSLAVINIPKNYHSDLKTLISSIEESLRFFS